MVVSPQSHTLFWGIMEGKMLKKCHHISTYDSQATALHVTIVKKIMQIAVKDALLIEELNEHKRN